MDNFYLLELINEANTRGGGLVLNLETQPAAVVLTINKYNELMQNQATSANDMPTDELSDPGPQKPSGPKQKILVTGGAGYIGSHCAGELLKSGYEVVVLDNLSCGKERNVPRGARFVEGDLADLGLLRDLFAGENFFAVMHLAASIEVEESVSQPEKYFKNNALNTAGLLSVMAEYGVRNIIFSSTCAVYGEQVKLPINEQSKVGPINPYGCSKLLAERIIKYYCQFLALNAVVFRYFNACGCGFDGDVEPTHSTHLLSQVLKVAAGEKASISVFGNDYGTFDGTCIRDYVHVLDIAAAHVAALQKIDPEKSAYEVYNIGAGKGSSVLEIISKTAEVLNKIIPMETAPRRPGDAPELVADNTKLKNQLGYHLKYSDLETIITTSWKQTQNYSS